MSTSANTAPSPVAGESTGPAESRPHRRYWDRHVDREGHWHRPDGADLAALRRGLGREPGSVPEMWPYYTTLNAEGRLTERLEAEHIALALYALHQQSRTEPMHRHGVGLGTAMQALRRSEKFSPEAVDRRFSAAATATSLGEVTAHLRGLVSQLRTISQGLDYNQLVRDLANWAHPERRSQVRRRWGSQYFVTTRRESDENDRTGN